MKIVYLESTEISKFHTPKYDTKVTGLPNIGNTCFMNSILQWLFASPKLNEYFMSAKYTDDLDKKSKTKGQLSKSYATLVTSAKSGNVTRSGVSDFKSFIGRWNSQFSGYGQQDSQEFLRFALDGLSNELNRITSKPKYKELVFKNESKHEQSEAWWDYFKSREDSFITDLFQGQLANITECHSCGHQSFSFDIFQDLSLSIPEERTKSLYSRSSTITLEQWLKDFTAEEKFDRDSGYKWEGCKKGSNISKRMSLFRFPPLLVIHLKRFSFSSWRRDKINTDVKFPIEKLDLSPYSDNEEVDSDKTTYHLYGISHHSGYMSGGHYVADIKNVWGDGKWHHCNDNWVNSLVDPSGSGSSPYVLFYYRSDLMKKSSKI
jgi:ubiquitin C-terminal hydrolase